MDAADEGYGTFACYAFTVNYILGVGCLAMPLLFERAGVLLAAAVVLAVSFMSLLTVVWVAESVARADMLADMLEAEGGPHAKGGCLLPCATAAAAADDERAAPPALTKPGSFAKELPPASVPSPPRDAPDGRGRRRVLSEDRIAYGSINAPAADAPARAAAAAPPLPRQLLPDEQMKIAGEELLAYRLAYRSYRLGSARGARGETPRSHGGHYERLPTNALRRAHSHYWRAPHGLLVDDTASILEVVALCELFLGRAGQVAYQASLMLLMTSGLVAYSQVFVATVSPFLAPLLPSGAAAGDARLPAVALYSAVVIPLSCFDLAEQVGVQVAMAGRG